MIECHTTVKHYLMPMLHNCCYCLLFLIFTDWVGLNLEIPLGNNLWCWGLYLIIAGACCSLEMTLWNNFYAPLSLMHIFSSNQNGAKFVSVCVSISVIIFVSQRGIYISISLACNQLSLFEARCSHYLVLFFCLLRLDLWFSISLDWPFPSFSHGSKKS